MPNYSSTNRTCFLGTGIHEVCPSNCKTVLGENKWIANIESVCIAGLKLNEFVEGNNTFTVTISAFLQAQPEIIDLFAGKNASTQDLVRYFTSICEPEEVGSIAERLSNEILFRLLDIDFQNFQNIKSMLGRKNQVANYFDLKSSRFWKFISQERICKLIAYLTKEKSLYVLAAQFLVILSPEVISKFNEMTELNEEEERNLFLALEDNIYTIPLVSPKIYGHMLEIFRDNLEIFFILDTMGPLVKRREEIEDISQSFLKYQKKTNQKLSIQWIYSELFGLEYELVVEVLSVLAENQYITLSEKSTLQNLLKNGNLESLSKIKLEILNQS
ncbi:MAG: hypothetical protein SFU98_07600 [Leptospiraceae bacterium]|nr:hypothetical protein [Leptospiraceae bacterium]